MASIKDVAELAGVSVTTVSRVMNNRGYISKKTRQLVEDAMNKLDYQPNQIARALQKSQSYLIGIIIPDLSHPLFSELITYIESYASEKNYKLLICNSLQESQKEKNYIKMLRQHRVDGIIMCSHTLDIDFYRQVDLPLVSFDRIISPGIPFVASDNYLGGEIATNHLIEQGCKKLLHISGPLHYDLLANHRSEAFKDSCIKNQVQWEIIEGAFIKSKFHENLDFIETHLTHQLTNYDGVFCSNDFMAYSLYVYALQKGIKVPEQLKIIGYDYHSFTRMLHNPILSTIKQPLDQIGKALFTTLIERIEEQTIDIKNTVLNSILIKGETT